jgi:hypothetical protein
MCTLRGSVFTEPLSSNGYICQSLLFSATPKCEVDFEYAIYVWYFCLGTTILPRVRNIYIIFRLYTHITFNMACAVVGKVTAGRRGWQERAPDISLTPNRTSPFRNQSSRSTSQENVTLILRENKSENPYSNFKNIFVSAMEVMVQSN